MKKEVFDKIKKEAIYLGGFLLIFIILLKIIFFKEDFLVILRISLSIFLLFLVPGYSVLFFWEDKIGFTERVVIGTSFSAAITGILSYYIGLMGINIKYHLFIIPILIIAAGVIINFRKIKK